MVDGDTYEEVEDQIRKARDEMYRIIGNQNVDLISYADGVGGNTPLPNGKGAEEFGGFAIVINGHSLVSAYLRTFNLV